MEKDFVGKIFPFIGIILLLLVVGFAFLSPKQEKLALEGDAPDFILPAAGGGTFTLSQLEGKKNVLLYFQEGLMCPPCWIQQVDIEKQKKDFDALDVEVVMVTVDPLNALEQGKIQYDLNGTTVLYDGALTASKLYNVLEDSMHPGERPGHVFVLVDKEGKIKWYYSAYKPPKNGDHHSGGGLMYVPVEFILNNVKLSLSG